MNMPELPEIETVKNALARCLPGRRITAIELYAEKMRTPLAPLKSPELLNSPIVEVRRRARYLVIELANGMGILMHLGMTGVVRVEPPRQRRKHEHVVATLDDGMTLRFECPRRFSVMQPVRLPAPGAEPAELARLGIEPLDAGFTGRYLHDRLARRKGPAKVAVMDNAIVVGVGNIYATEALFAAGIRPDRPADALSLQECESLVAEIRRVLMEAIAAGGSSIRDYRHVDGSEGAFAQELKVYGRAGAPCPHCGAVIEAKKLGGRTSAYCPGCQK